MTDSRDPSVPTAAALQEQHREALACESARRLPDQFYEVITQRDAAVEIAEKAVRQVARVALASQSSMSLTWLAPSQLAQVHNAIAAFRVQLAEAKVDPLRGPGRVEDLVAQRDKAATVTKAAMELVSGIISSSIEATSPTVLEHSERVRLRDTMAILGAQLASVGAGASHLAPSVVVDQVASRAPRR